MSPLAWRISAMSSWPRQLSRASWTLLANLCCWWTVLLWHLWCSRVAHKCTHWEVQLRTVRWQYVLIVLLTCQWPQDSPQALNANRSPFGSNTTTFNSINSHSVVVQSTLSWKENRCHSCQCCKGWQFHWREKCTLRIDPSALIVCCWTLKCSHMYASVFISSQSFVCRVLQTPCHQHSFIRAQLNSFKFGTFSDSRTLVHHWLYKQSVCLSQSRSAWYCCLSLLLSTPL